MDTLHHLAGLYHSLTHLQHTFASAHDEMATSAFERATETADALRSKLPEHLQRPRVAIVCGSGLGGLQDSVDDGAETWDYRRVPNFPLSTAPGHEGKLVFGTMGQQQTPVLLLVGRAHFYEGHSMQDASFATRVCKVLGVQTMILTNAAGGLNPEYNVGDLVCLHDHLNFVGLAGFHPLRGPNLDEFGTRFPPLSDAYDIHLRQLAHRSWKELRQQNPSTRRLHEGVYAFVAGPTYETRAECRMLRHLGGDLVGMSTVPEVVTARHCGMRVLAFSLVTNKCLLEPTLRADDPKLQGMSREELDHHLQKGMANHAEVLEEGRLAALEMQALVLRIVSEL